MQVAVVVGSICTCYALSRILVRRRARTSGGCYGWWWCAAVSVTAPQRLPLCLYLPLLTSGSGLASNTEKSAALDLVTTFFDTIICSKQPKKKPKKLYPWSLDERHSFLLPFPLQHSTQLSPLDASSAYQHFFFVLFPLSRLAVTKRALHRSIALYKKVWVNYGEYLA
ncbi:hypothetical protein CDEST_06472 [Colletotrichum destructivum]|uniref:Secreted protein n=1 Tax=Colletotrichum destructivum TaxID=34406 RepID=A0AAX4IF82_9PEZI|nr:hypothetical protein CDEST_06472 [Colletotrichum destructivum]